MRVLGRISRAEWAFWLTGLYYDRLNADPGFSRDLAALFTRLEKMGVRPPSAGGELWGEAEGGDPSLMAEWARAYQGSPLGQHYQMALSLRREVDAFLARWPLPRRIWQDLRSSYEAHLHWGKPWGREPRLELGGHGEWLPTPGLPVVVDVRERDGIRVRAMEHQPWIFPSLPLPFLYDPLRHDRGWLEGQIEAICREIRESILAQAKAYREEVEAQGFSHPHPSWEKAEKAVGLLYLRAVKRLSWAQIKLKTGCDEAQARRQVRHYAALIGLPLAETPER